MTSSMAQNVTVDPSSGFSVEYFEKHKVITNLINNETYALVCCELDTSAYAQYDVALNTPLSSVSIDTELQLLPFFELLAITDKVKSASPSANITSPCFENITQLSANSTGVDAIFSTKTNNGVSPKHIGVSLHDTKLTPLQQSSWIIFVGFFFGLEKEAYDVYHKISQKYICHKSNLEKTGKKNIAWTSYNAVNDEWCIYNNNYIHTLTKDAGLTLKVPNNQTTYFKNKKEFQSALHQADYVIDITWPENFKEGFSFDDWRSAAGFDPSDPNYSHTPFLAKRSVYRTDNLVDKNGYSDWHNRHAARADIFLTDIIHMVYNTYEPSYKSTWLRAISQTSRPNLISDTTYPSCTDTSQRIAVNICHLEAFNPDNTRSTAPEYVIDGSKLSTAGKIGVAIGVVVGTVAIAAIGYSIYRNTVGKKVDGRPFYRMEHTL